MVLLQTTITNKSLQCTKTKNNPVITIEDSTDNNVNFVSFKDRLIVHLAESLSNVGESVK